MSGASADGGGGDGAGGTPRPLRALLVEWVFAKQVPAGVGFLRALGTALFVVLLTQAVTGMLLALCYVPSPDHAYNSVRFIDHEVKSTLGGHEIAVGRLVRGLHHWGAGAVIVLAFLHLLRTFFTGAYKRPRALLWVLGVALFGVLLGFGFTGYLLPWDMKAFWATDVGMTIVATVPEVGPALADLLRGGPELGAPTLTRMFALHVLILPALLIPLAGLHLLLVHRLGITPPGARVGAPEVKGAPFFPDHVVRELLVAAAALGVVGFLAWKLGAPLEAPASRELGEYEPRPEWYFLGLFQLLKLEWFQGDRVWYATALLPGAVGALLLLLPWLDRGKERSASQRPIATTLGVLAVAGVVGMTAWGFWETKDDPKRPPPPYVPVGDLAYVPPSSPPFAPPTDATAGGGTPAVPADPASARAEALLAESGCVDCHTLRGEGDSSGAGGPELRGLADGHDAAWYAAFLLNPKQFKPDIDMPSAADLELADADRFAIAEWLAANARK
ncbi:MAG: c-type cytochrome [Planctomycetes bacterium]|nr:c-type cytochrome [Planctomycetota bacterium]